MQGASSSSLLCGIDWDWLRGVMRIGNSKRIWPRLLEIPYFKAMGYFSYPPPFLSSEGSAPSFLEDHKH